MLSALMPWFVGWAWEDLREYRNQVVVSVWMPPYTKDGEQHLCACAERRKECRNGPKECSQGASRVYQVAFVP